MKKYITVVGVLGLIQVVLLTLVGLYFYRLGQAGPGEAPASPSPSEEERVCVRAGCSQQLCVDAEEAADIVTTCEYRDSYACYAVASCELQSDGHCGFTQTDELTTCLKTIRMTPPDIQGGVTLPEQM